MQFVVKFLNRKCAKPDEHPHVILTQDNWDDYGYKSTFNAELHLTDETLDLGVVKILHADQVSGYTPMPDEPFESLGRDYYSLGGDLSYYEKLFKCGPRIYRAYLKALGDVAYSDVVRARFEDKEGYRVSLLRLSGAERTITDAGRLLARHASVPVPKRRGAGFMVKFKTQVAPDANPFLLEFDFRRKGRLPNRINVVIGYNGTGKTRLLSNLAIAASGYGYARKEDLLAKTAGRFVGNPPPFKTVVVVSYSAFDTFVIPGQNEIEKARLRDEGAIFGYVYCGLRERTDDAEEGAAEQYRLRTPQEIEAEFLASLSRVRDAKRLDALVAVLRPLLQDASFQRIGLTQVYADQSNSQLAELFRTLSSGHKVVLKIVIDLAAHMDDTQPTLVLIDEPETHLHPPLLAALLKSVRACLDHFDGYAVVATHSPVVLQETPSRYVHVLKRMGCDSRVAPASIETFGENIGVITQDVFNLDDGSTDWHDTLRSLAKILSLDKIEELFGHRLGFGARSYVVSLGDDEEG